jgi:transcriptional regulator with XRE-family HTH domain
LGVEKKYTRELKQFGKRVKLEREKAELTQQALAEACDIDIRSVQRLEAGIFNPSLRTLHALADALKKPAHELLKPQE